MDSPTRPTGHIRRTRPGRSRSDGWTGARQLAFLDALARTRSVTRAAASAGMSRESAYRLRSRDPDGLFSVLWGRNLATAERSFKSHIRALNDGRIARLVGNHRRRESGDFASIGAARERSAENRLDANFVTLAHGTKIVS